MRILTTTVLAAALALGTPALVLAQAAPPAAATATPKANTTIRAIKVVDVKELQPAVRSQVDKFVATTRQEDMQSLRQTLDALPEAASALKEKGLTSSQVVAINIEDGVLTMFAKTA